MTTPLDSAIAEVIASDRAKVFEPIDFPVKLMKIPNPAVENQDIKGRRAVVRTDTGDVLNIVSDKYSLIPHGVIFKTLDAAIASLAIPVISRKVRTAYNGGYAKTVWTLDRKLSVPSRGSDDLINITIHARNSYNYSSMLGLELGAYRLICENGLIVGKILAQHSKRHVPSLNVPGMVKEIISMLEETEQVHKTYTHWAEIDYPRNRFEERLNEMPIAKKARREILDYFTVQPDRTKIGDQPQWNLWEAFNAVTWYSTHRAGSKSPNTQLVSQESLLELANQFALGEARSN